MMRIIMYCQKIQHIAFITLKLCRGILMLKVDKLNSLGILIKFVKLNCQVFCLS